MNTTQESRRGWHLSGRERTWLAVGLFACLVFGVNLEKRTALRRTPMTDLGVFSCAAGAVLDGNNLYTVNDWHGWHYQYPPALAILFTPLALPAPAGPPLLSPGVARTQSNTPWGYDVPGCPHFYGLHADNIRFFWIVAVWYVISLALIFLSAHLLACVLDRCSWMDPPPVGLRERRRWWWLRTLPLLVCAGSLGTDLSRGQVDVVMLAAMAFALYLAAAGRQFKAGFWLSLPATIKLFPVLLIIHPIWRRSWRMVAGAIAGLVLALAILPAAVLGPTRTTDLYRVWIQVLAKPALGQGTDTSRIQELTGMAGTDNQSLLAFIHNWRYHDLPRSQRPQQAPPVERYTAYAIGAVILFGVVLAMGFRRPDSPRDLLIIAGLLIGAALVVNPVAHNYYFLLLLPLVAALLDYGLADPAGLASDPKTLLVVAVFTVIDLVARFPVIGPWLRDCGLPLLSVVGIMWMGAMVLRKSDRRRMAKPAEMVRDSVQKDRNLKATTT